MLPAIMGHFEIGFFEEFVLLLMAGTFLGVTLFVTAGFLVRWSRGKASVMAAAAPILLLAMLFFFINIPRIREAVVQGLPYFLGMGLLAMMLLAWGNRSRGMVSKGVSGVLFLGACAVLLTFSIFQFVTARHTSFRDGELVALVEVSPSEFPPGYEIENEAVWLRYKDRKPIPALEVEMFYFADGDPAGPVRVKLAGQKWGVGGELLHVKNWFFLFGDRTFCRLTGIDAKFKDLSIPAVGYNLPDYDPHAIETSLDAELPLINRKLRELCNVETVKIEYDQFIYQSIEDGQYFGIYVQPGGGFVPKPMSAEEYLELRKSRFPDPAGRLL